MPSANKIMIAVKFDDVSKHYKLYNKGGLYLRDRVTHALQRLNPFNHWSPVSGPPSAVISHPLEHDFLALKNVSFEIKKGEAVGIIGRNGAGKSTILKLLAEVSKPTSGTVTVEGKVAALIEVGAGFHPELTGRENVYLNGTILGMRKWQIDKLFEQIVAFAELEDFIDTPVKHYSSGMFVRLGFAIAAHTNPDVYLIDEVLSVGDEVFRKKCLEFLKRHKTAGRTMIIVSHQLQQIDEICDRCIYLDHGQIRHDGSPVTAIEHYRSDLDQAEIRARNSDHLGGEAQILGVSFYDGKGNELSTVRTGEDLIIEVRYVAHRPIEDPVFGIGIHGPHGEKITGFNSRTSSTALNAIEGTGSIFCRLSNLPLRTGRHRIGVGLMNSKHKVLDLKLQRYPILVRCEEPYTDGLIRFNGEWAQDIAFRRPYPAAGDFSAAEGSDDTRSSRRFPKSP
jgi:ABC-type polysaccharide/polyol phosphate transport system ATPase subunit